MVMSIISGTPIECLVLVASACRATAPSDAFFSGSFGSPGVPGDSVKPNPLRRQKLLRRLRGQQTRQFTWRNAMVEDSGGDQARSVLTAQAF